MRDSDTPPTQSFQANYRCTDDQDLVSRYQQVRQQISDQPEAPVDFDSFMIVMEMYRRSKNVVARPKHYILPQMESEPDAAEANIEALVESAQSIEEWIKERDDLISGESQTTYPQTPTTSASTPEIQNDLVMMAFAYYKSSRFTSAESTVSKSTSHPEHLDFSEITEPDGSRDSVTVNEVIID
ncbi:MAG: hypothetical protein AAGJ35_03090 [Myxococcota bacterium]